VVALGAANDLDRFDEAPEPARSVDELVAWVRERGRLPKRSAEAVVLTRVAGMSVEEVAAVHGISVEASYQRRYRAEQRLRRSLGQTR
jgi:DNA-directed RNA polymerase specialized sigma24 family protein